MFVPGISPKTIKSSILSHLAPKNTLLRKVIILKTSIIVNNIMKLMLI